MKKYLVSRHMVVVGIDIVQLNSEVYNPSVFATPSAGSLETGKK